METEIGTMSVLVHNSSLDTAPLSTITENPTADGEEVLPGVFQENCTANVNCTCTPLSTLDLMSVFTRMDIGNTEFWGNISVAWMACFIIYYVLFSILLVIMACSVVYFFKKLLRFFACILTLFLVWSCCSCIHYTLLMNGVIHGSTIQLANTARALEIITSSSFMNFAIATILSSNPDSHSSWRYMISIVIPIYLITAVIIAVSLVAESSALTALIVLRSLIFIVSIILVNSDFNYKRCFKIKEHLNLLWRQMKILIYLYLFISFAYFSYTLITIASNSSCIEDIELHRAVWLAFNCLLRICEVGFSIAYFVKIRNKIETISIASRSKTRGLTNWMKSHIGRQENHKPPLKSTSFTYQLPPLSEIGIQPNFSSSTNLNDTVVPDQSDVTKEQNDHATVVCEQMDMNMRTGMIEIEPLFQNPNYYRQYSEKSCNSEAPFMQSSVSSVTCSLRTDVSQSVNSIVFSNESLYTTELSSIINDVGIISARSPIDTEYLIGGTEVKMFDERGGVFHSYNHGVTVIVPPGAIPSGVLAELKFAATLVAPVKFTCVTPVSALFWLCMEVVLQKPIQIRLPEMFTKNRSSRLQFAKSLHSPVKTIEQQMDVLDGGKFTAGQCYASIEVDHFCYYCIVDDKLDPSNIPQNQYLLIAMKQQHLTTKDNNWTVHICAVPLIRTCVKHLKSQYNDDWKLEVLLEFRFEDGCSELQIDFSTETFENEAKVELLSDMKVRQEDVDFHQYYTKGRLEDLKFRMDQKLYPPRRKARVQAKHTRFFESSRSLDFRLVCGKKCISAGKIIIPSSNNDSCEVSSSESDSSLQRNKSITSGYRSKSEESIECLPDENELLTGELQLRNLILQTKKVERKWFELGIALNVPIDKLERIYDKHYDSPVKALIRVYRYWLADKNGLMPTWKKLVIALQKIDEYSLSTNVAKYMPQDDDPHPNATMFSDVSNQSMKELVEKHVQPILLNFPTLVPVLNKYHLLTQSDNYILMNRLLPPVERANALVYQILPTKGPRAYEMFIKCLQEETEHLGHQELAKKFEKPKTMETTV